MSAAASFTRIVSLVAECTRRERRGEDAATIGDLATSHGVAPDTITEDIRTLTILGDHANHDWLLSLRVAQQGDEVSISSAGPFRRPVRFSPEEQMALQLALALEPGGAALAERLARVWREPRVAPAAATDGVPRYALDDIRTAIAEHRVIEFTYAGEADRQSRRRVAHPHQVAELGVTTYVVAWAPDVQAWRHFRLDRIAELSLTEESFTIRDDFTPVSEPGDVFRSVEAAERVTVRFDSSAAPWVAEAHPDHELLPDGCVLVRLPATSAEWLVRRVLEFGAEAEVVDPPHYRAAVRQAVA